MSDNKYRCRLQRGTSVIIPKEAFGTSRDLEGIIKHYDPIMGECRVYTGSTCSGVPFFIRPKYIRLKDE